jgi:hypothetical protein
MNGEERIEVGRGWGRGNVGKAMAAAGVDVLDVSLIAQASWTEESGCRYLAASPALEGEPAGRECPAYRVGATIRRGV